MKAGKGWQRDRGGSRREGEGCWPCRLSGVACSVTFCCMWLKFLTPCSGTLGVMEGGSTGEREREREGGGLRLARSFGFMLCYGFLWPINCNYFNAAK